MSFTFLFYGKSQVFFLSFVEGESLVIKFDMKEWILPTAVLPFHNTTVILSTIFSFCLSSVILS